MAEGAFLGVAPNGMDVLDRSGRRDCGGEQGVPAKRSGLQRGGAGRSARSTGRGSRGDRGGAHDGAPGGAAASAGARGGAGRCSHPPRAAAGGARPIGSDAGGGGVRGRDHGLRERGDRLRRLALAGAGAGAAGGAGATVHGAGSTCAGSPAGRDRPCGRGGTRWCSAGGRSSGHSPRPAARCGGSTTDRATPPIAAARAMARRRCAMELRWRFTDTIRAGSPTDPGDVRGTGPLAHPRPAVAAPLARRPALPAGRRRHAMSPARARAPRWRWRTPGAGPLPAQRRPAGGQAFAAFERVRRPRVEAIFREARRNSSGKAVSGAAAWFRDRLLPLFLRLGASAQTRHYGFRAQWQ